jgi:hypothetical protein
VTPGTDINNCGACGNVCTLTTNATGTSCSGSACHITSCGSTFADCNGTYSDGCEINKSNDINNCGSCGNVCTAGAQVSATACSGSACHVIGCNTGFADCNGTFSDGCEVNTTNDINNCASCGHACAAVPNATQGCLSSTCVIASCNTDFYDLNGVYSDGCECGAPNAGPTCAGADPVATVAWGSSVTRTGSLPPGSAGEHWYSVSFTPGAAGPPPQYHPVITVSGAAPGFTLDVYTDCASSTLNCGEGGVSTLRATWEVQQTAGDSTNMGFVWSTPAPGTVLYVRVRPAGATACNPYSITFSNM